MAKSRKEMWLGLAVLGFGLVPVAIAGLWGYMRFTAPTLHPDPAGVSATLRGTPPSRWARAVEEARQHVRESLAAQNLPGLSAAVGIDDDVVWAEGFGLADLETRVPMAPETQLRLGTASVALTSAAVGLLVEEERLALEAEIQSYVPAFPKKEWPVTLRHLMAHVSGVRNDGGDEGPLLSEQCDRPVDALPTFASRPLLFQPGTRFRVSSYGWIVVSAAVESASQQPFLTFMQKRIIEPLGMWDTEADSNSDPRPNRATFYFPRFAAAPRYGLHPMRPLEHSCYAGAGVFLSTPSDLVRFGLAVQSGKLLRPATVAALQSSQRLSTGEATDYGLGWVLGSAEMGGEQTRWAGYEGTLLGGPIASLITFPNHHLAISVMANSAYADTKAVALVIARAFVDGTAEP